MSDDVIDIDKGWKALMRMVREEPMSVAVGYIDGVTDQTNLKLALIHEFGTKRIPERSFLRTAYDENFSALCAVTDKLAAAWLAKKETQESALNKLGLWLANKIKNKIRKGPFKPLEKATVARKGSTKPLIDTGEMLNAATWQVRKGK